MNHFVFDVESVGLHGNAFAVGFAVVNEAGVRIDEGLFACNPDMVAGSSENRTALPAREWVRDNVPTLEYNCASPFELCEKFWDKFSEWRGKGASFWADCGWPVEARFLIECIEWNVESREWEGPYPLHEISTLAMAAKLNPLETWPRLPDELPKHNPLCDARQSARLLIEFFVAARMVSYPAIVVEETGNE